MRRVAATTSDGKTVKVPMQEIIASRLLHNAKNGDVQTFRLLFKIMPRKAHKPRYNRIEILRPTKSEAEWQARKSNLVPERQNDVP